MILRILILTLMLLPNISALSHSLTVYIVYPNAEGNLAEKKFILEVDQKDNVANIKQKISEVIDTKNQYFDFVKNKDFRFIVNGKDINDDNANVTTLFPETFLQNKAYAAIWPKKNNKTQYQR